MILFVAWIAIIYCILAAAIFLAAGVIVGRLHPPGILGDLLSVVTDSTFILIFSWTVAGLTLHLVRREH